MAGDIGAEIARIMEAYGHDVDGKLQKVMQQTAKECAQKLNDASAIFKESGHTKTPYAGSWTSTKDGEGYTVHSKLPGLPHLLEHGHNVVSHGKAVGFSPGKTHIAPIAEEMTQEFEKRAREAAGG